MVAGSGGGVIDELRLAVHLTAGESSQLWLSENPADVTWSSMDSSVATVSATGQVAGIAHGLAIVQGEIDGEIYRIYVRVV